MYGRLMAYKSNYQKQLGVNALPRLGKKAKKSKKSSKKTSKKVLYGGGKGPKGESLYCSHK